MSNEKLKVYFFKNSRLQATRDMHSRPMVGDIVCLKTGDYEIKKVIWPYRGDNERDYLECNVVIKS